MRKPFCDCGETGWRVEAQGAVTLRVGASPGQDFPPHPPLHLLELHSGHQRAPDSAQTSTSYPVPSWGGGARFTTLVPASAPQPPADSPRTPPTPTCPPWPSPVCDVHSSPRWLQCPLPALSRGGPEPHRKSPSSGRAPRRVAPATFMLSPGPLPALGLGAPPRPPLC